MWPSSPSPRPTPSPAPPRPTPCRSTSTCRPCASRPPASPRRRWPYCPTPSPSAGPSRPVVGTWFAVDAASLILSGVPASPRVVDRLVDGLEDEAQRVGLPGRHRHRRIVAAVSAASPERALAACDGASRSPHQLTRAASMELAGTAGGGPGPTSPLVSARRGLVPATTNSAPLPAGRTSRGHRRTRRRRPPQGRPHHPPQVRLGGPHPRRARRPRPGRRRQTQRRDRRNPGAQQTNRRVPHLVHPHQTRRRQPRRTCRRR